jgi:cyanophycinase
VRRPMFERNRVALLPLTRVPAGPYVRRPFVMSLAGVLLGLLPLMMAAEPKVAPSSPPLMKSDIVGALVIVGGGVLPNSIRDCFLDLAGGREKTRLVVIPTASELADRMQDFKSYAYWQAQNLKSVSMLHTLDHKKANDPAFVEPLTHANAAWLSGGDQSRLAGAYHGTAVERELRRLLNRGGVIGGTSAGASVMSSVMITGGNPRAVVGTGFGLLPDVVIDQHFENRRRRDRLLWVVSQYPSCLGLGIDEQTAVVVRGHTFTVVGNARVVDQKGEWKVLKSGESGDLLSLGQNMYARPRPPADKPALKEQRATMP